jgi:hypothetical protein
VNGVDYTILQTAADTDSVIDALTTLAPGWSDRTGIQHAQAWTTVPMEPRAAGQFAPLLANLLGRGVLVWTVDSEQCRVSLHRTNGSVVEAVDRPDQVDALARAFHESHLLVSTEGDKDKTALASAAADMARSPCDRHKAFSELLGVPHVAPTRQPGPNPTSPSLTTASTPLGTDHFRRRERIRSTRSWLHLFSGLGGVGIVLLVIRGPWLLIPVFLVVIGVLQVIRLWIGRSLPPGDAKSRPVTLG